MKTIRMLTSEIGADGETLEAGSSQTLNDASADRWLRRGKAELIEDAPAPKAKAATEGELQALVESAVADREASGELPPGSAAPAEPPAPAAAPAPKAKAKR